MANPWFRLYSEFASDPKVQSMSETLQRRLIMLFCLRCSNVLETLQENEIVYALGISEEEWEETKKVFVSKCFIRFIKGKCNIINWNKRQFISDSSTERVRKYRAKKETFPERSDSVTVTPSDTDSEQNHIHINKEESLPPEDIALSGLIFTLHHDNIDTGYNATEERRKKWAADIEKLNRIDSRSWQDIESAIRWIKTPGNFWAANILSGSKLREKFPTIWGQMKQRGEVPQEVPRPSLPKETPGPDFMRELVKRHREELEAANG